MAEILSLAFANEMSNGPPDMTTRMTGPLEALATAEMSCVCWPGNRRLVLSRLSLSIDWSAPTTSTVTSALAAAATAVLSWRLFPLHPTLLHPGWYTVATLAPRPWSGVVYLHGVPDGHCQCTKQLATIL
jgi:hypothetical protein